MFFKEEVLLHSSSGPSARRRAGCESKSNDSGNDMVVVGEWNGDVEDGKNPAIPQMIMLPQVPTANVHRNLNN